MRNVENCSTQMMTLAAALDKALRDSGARETEALEKRNKTLKTDLRAKFVKIIDLDRLAKCMAIEDKETKSEIKRQTSLHQDVCTSLDEIVDSCAKLQKEIDEMFALLFPADEEISAIYEKILEISANCTIDRTAEVNSLQERLKQLHVKSNDAKESCAAASSLLAKFSANLLREDPYRISSTEMRRIVKEIRDCVKQKKQLYVNARLAVVGSSQRNST